MNYDSHPPTPLTCVTDATRLPLLTKEEHDLIFPLEKAM